MSDIQGHRFLIRRIDGLFAQIKVLSASEVESINYHVSRLRDLRDELEELESSPDDDLLQAIDSRLDSIVHDSPVLWRVYLMYLNRSLVEHAEAGLKYLTALEGSRSLNDRERSRVEYLRGAIKDYDADYEVLRTGQGS